MSGDALDCLALTHRITIVVLEEAAGRPTAMSSFAKNDEGVNIIDDSSAPSGMPSWIELNEGYLHELVRLRARGSANHLKILNLRFQLAVTSIHELAVSTPNLMRLLLHIVDPIPRNEMQAISPLLCFVALLDSRLTPRTDTDFETLQHAIIAQSYKAQCTDELIFANATRASDNPDLVRHVSDILWRGAMTGEYDRYI